MTEILGNNAEQALKQFAERIMRLDEEAAALVGDRKHVFQEAVAAGFDEKVLKKVIKELQLPEGKRSKQLEFELVVDTYRKALGLPTNEDVIVGEVRKRVSGERREEAA